MECLHGVLSNHPGNYKDIMIWAACCLAYFGLLRVSEFTTSSPDRFDSSTDLLLSDVALDNRTSPTSIQITLKQSKNDQFRAGTIYNMPREKTTHTVCPVDALEVALRDHCFYYPATNHSPEHHSVQPSTKPFRSYTWIIASLIHTVLELVLLHPLNMPE